MPNNQMAMSPLLREHDAQTSVLRFLWRSRAEWSGREIARKVGLSAPSCHEILKKLDARGLVLLRRVSNVHLYQINPENYFVQNVYARLFEAEAAMPKQVEAAITRSLVEPSESSVISLVLFGSMARGTAWLGSDLDLMVVIASKECLKVLEPRVEKLRDMLFKRFNIPLAPYVQTLSELRHKHVRKLPLIIEILKEGRTIYGKDVKEMLS